MNMRGRDDAHPWSASREEKKIKRIRVALKQKKRKNNNKCEGALCCTLLSKCEINK
jgi:hypothetical protein